MAASFKVAEAYADFHVNVDKGLDEAVAKIKSRAKDLDLKAEVKMDADTTLAEARIKRLADSRNTAKVKVDADESSLQNAGRKVDDEMSKVAARTNAKFSALTFAALSLGLPAAAAAGATAVVGSLALASAAFDALLIAGVKDTAGVQAAMRTLSEGVRGDVRVMTAPLQGEVIGAIQDVGAAWTRLRPQVMAATTGAADGIRTLVGAGTDLAENVMPGLVTAVRAAPPALDGLRTFAGQVGQGLGDFFTNASRGAQGAQQGFTVFGGTVQTLEGRLGTLFANLANGSAGPLRSLDVIVDQVTQGLNRMTQQGSGAMGFLQGFGNAGSGLATVLNGVMGALSALPPQVTQFGGSMTAATMIASKFGVDAGAGFEGLGKKVGAAEGAAGKFKTAIGGLAAGAINPAFLAVGALSVGLDLLGEAQQAAAARAAAHRDNVRELTQALREDGGVVGANTAAKNASALADKNAANNLSVYGQSISTATAAIQGSVSARDAMNASANATISSIGKESGLTDTQIGKIQGLSQGLLKTGGNYASVKSDMDNYTTSMNAQGNTVDKLTAAQRDQINALMNGQGAVGEQIASQAQAQAAYYASEHALTGLSQSQIAARDATNEHTASMYAQIDASLGYRGTVLQSKAAIDELNKVNTNQKSTEDQKAAAMLAAETAMSRQIAAAGQLAIANSGATNDAQKLAAQVAGQTAETIKLASQWQGPLPASLQTAISKMSVADAQSNGLKTSVNNLGQAVVTLPNGKNIVLTSNAAAEEARVRALKDQINALHDRDIRISVSYYGDASRATSLTGPRVAFAEGGRPIDRIPHLATGGPPAALNVKPGGQAKGPGTGTSDGILAAISTDEMVVKAKETRRNISELYAINSGQRDYEKYPATGRPPARVSLGSAGGSGNGGSVVINVYTQPAQDEFAIAQQVTRILEMNRQVT